ncbi:methyl-accepting chemotaxis protein [Paraburkholderia phenoliruptrix]|uniref:methyl-accepting chemotaxis protein n=1 Tax=Paraburkholderia phenoliruptrix TaxID=252970 RepID=UPI001C6E4515|nr:methyl-accepting chemotaxis protein [Paraburkholderia phenoliruptrix]MBW9102320.1 MCP four helix bundle domain-containing protein [Paraburkholderia phenoliruptrix]MBW9127541.1 MCP four helix bundle domain-containing protein [Paraburkholderia ginsengiterrae]
MKYLGNLRIGTRLRIGFGITLLLLMMTGGLAMLQASRIYAGTEEIADNWLASVQTLGEIRALANGVRRASLRSVMESEATAKQSQRAQHDAALSSFKTAMASYEKLVSSPEERQIFDNLTKAWAAFETSDTKLLQLSESGDTGFAAARSLATGESATLFTQALQLVEQDVKLNRAGAAAARTDAAGNYHATLVLTGVLCGAALLLSVVVAWLITRSIVTPLERAVGIAETVARGDLTSEIEVSGRDETSQLLLALRNMNARLLDVVSRVRSSSESIATGSAQIAAGNTDLSQRTEEQAASLEETAASMEQLTATVKQNTDNARQGNTLASNASEVAARGGQVVAEVVDTMHDISDSSAKVAEIIAVIEGIAFQTNILALNAAVEAARAGEEGRGFAVVASEVRGLAQRSASAAREIKELINQSVAKVEAGTLLVDNAGATMKEVVDSVKRVTDLMGEIASASVEQHTGIEQVNQAVMQMDEVTQQNAALVEEASAAAQSMASQSSTLRELVSVFRLPDSFSVSASVSERATVAPTVAKQKNRMPRKAPVAADSNAGNGDWQNF